MSHLVHNLCGRDFHRHLPLDGDEPRSVVRASVHARLCLSVVGASLRAGFALYGKRKGVANGYESIEKGDRYVSCVLCVTRRTEQAGWKCIVRRITMSFFLFPFPILEPAHVLFLAMGRCLRHANSKLRHQRS